MNWNDLRCTPDIFAFNVPTNQTGNTKQIVAKTSKLMEQKGYMKLPIQWDGVQVYVVTVLAEQYRINYVNFSKVQKLKKMLPLQTLLSQVGAVSRRRVFAHPFTDTANIYFIR